MTLEFSVSNYIKQHNSVMNSIDIAELESAIELIRDKAFSGKKIAVCGNGGSALAASHYITDWNKMVNLETGQRFNGVCLSDNVGLVTAYANDLSYDDVFSEQVKNLLFPNDLLITVSNTTAHLSGAIGAETWVMAPKSESLLFYWKISFIK